MYITFCRPPWKSEMEIKTNVQDVLLMNVTQRFNDSILHACFIQKEQRSAKIESQAYHKILSLSFWFLSLHPDPLTNGFSNR